MPRTGRPRAVPIGPSSVCRWEASARSSWALKRPDLYAFAAGISPAVEVPSRPFSIKRPFHWRSHRSIFGPWGGRAQQENDPFVLARSVDPSHTPYLFITCGDQEGLLAANRKL